MLSSRRKKARSVAGRKYFYQVMFFAVADPTEAYRFSWEMQYSV